MTDHIIIGDTAPRIQYQADGAQTVFTYPFPIFAAEDLQVFVGTAQAATGFTVAGAGQSAGGSVTFDAAPAEGAIVTLRRLLAIERSTDFQEGGALRARTLNDELDRQTAFIQQVASDVARTLALDPTAPAAALDPLPALEAGRTLVVNPGATGLALGPSSAAIAEAIVQAGSAAASATAAGVSAGSAAASASAAAGSAGAAEAARLAAEAAAAASFFNEVLDKSADFTVAAADEGKLLRIDTSGGARTVTLGAIATLGEGFRVTIEKHSADADTVTVMRSGTDDIGGQTGFVIAGQYKAATFVADLETGSWTVIPHGIATENRTVDSFLGDGATAAFVLSADPGSAANTQLFVDGVYQAKAGYALAGATLTFPEAPPVGAAIEVVSARAVPIGTPGDGTVTPAAFAAQTQGRLLYYGASGAAALLAPGLAGQVLTTNGPDADPEWTSPPAPVFTKSYTSPEQTIVSGGALTLAHGLGVAPKMIVCKLVCKIAEAGYGPGDELFINPHTLDGTGGGTTGFGQSVIGDADNLYVRYGVNGYTILRKDAGDLDGITPANWMFVVSAYA